MGGAGRKSTNLESPTDPTRTWPPHPERLAALPANGMGPFPELQMPWPAWAQDAGTAGPASLSVVLQSNLLDLVYLYTDKNIHIQLYMYVYRYIHIYRERERVESLHHGLTPGYRPKSESSDSG